MKYILLCVACVLCSISIVWCDIRQAEAQPPQGLYWDWKTTGIASVQRFTDSSNGVVCYVAKRTRHDPSSVGDNDFTPAISCVKP